MGEDSGARQKNDSTTEMTLFASPISFVGLSGSSSARCGLIPQRNPTFTLLVGFQGGLWQAEAVTNRPSTQHLLWVSSQQEEVKVCSKKCYALF